MRHLFVLTILTLFVLSSCAQEPLSQPSPTPTSAPATVTPTPEPASLPAPPEGPVAESITTEQTPGDDIGSLDQTIEEENDLEALSSELEELETADY